MKFRSFKFILYIFFYTPFVGIAQLRIAVAGMDKVSNDRSGRFSIIPSDLESNYVIQVVPEICIGFFTGNKKFICIDRKNLSLLKQEKELQKSEDFIDGYIVDQGKSEGVDLMLKPLYYEKDQVLSIKIYDIAKGNVKCLKEQKFESGILGIKGLQKQTRLMLHDLMWSCFNIKYTVVRSLSENPEKADELLVGFGTKHKVEEADEVQFFEIVEEEIDSEKFQTKKHIGKGSIKEVQDDNFSKVKVKDGEKRITDLLKKGVKLYCTINNSYANN